tara:strand:+ start:12261 stop:13400 length:1140 start_codon:yes stop_codon:yes gene_type:complete
MDYSATCPLDPKVLKAMIPYLGDKFGNSSSLHSLGRETSEKVKQCRTILSKFLNAKNDEIIFTSSATESNNMALKGIAFANKEKGKHIIISSIEHACIIKTSEYLEKQGFEITKLPVNKHGLVQAKDLEQAIRKNTILVSIIHANNEIGVIQNIEELGKICQVHGVLFHTDASQSFGKLKIDVGKMNLNLLTASSHKIYGPKGAGLLYIQKGVKIEPLLHGGGHEFGLRSSTVNVSAIAGFAKAVEIMHKNMSQECARIAKMRDFFINQVLDNIPDSYLNGHTQERLCNNINFSFKGVEGESLVMQLDLAGIAGSTGSACASSKHSASHVLLALGMNPKLAKGSLRLSLGRWTTTQEIKKTLHILQSIVKKLRKVSGYK